MSNIEKALRRAQREADHGGSPVPLSPAAQDDAPQSSAAPEVAGVWALDARIVAFHERYSIAAEAFRKLAAKLLAHQRQHELPCILVGITSATHDEGKSLTAANLAVVLAQDFRVPTLLVDTDLRRPTFAQYLGLSLSTGLADLVGGASLEDTIVGTPLPDLQLLGSGSGENPTAVFESGRLTAALRMLRGAASVVLFDCPPTLAVADTQLLAPHLDGTILVVRAGRSQGRDIRRMLECLHDAPLLGFALNYADMASPAYYSADAYYARPEDDSTRP